MIKDSLLIIALVAVAVPALAQDIESMNPKALQDAATAATSAGDADHLLQIMQEMQRREMLFFKPAENPLCDREPAKTGYFETAHPAHWGAAKQWYFMKLREIRLAEESCECLGATASFDEILEENFKIGFDGISKEIIFAMRDERDAKEIDVNSHYRSFHRANCRGE